MARAQRVVQALPGRMSEVSSDRMGSVEVKWNGPSELPVLDSLITAVVSGKFGERVEECTFDFLEGKPYLFYDPVGGDCWSKVIAWVCSLDLEHCLIRSAT